MLPRLLLTLPAQDGQPVDPRGDFFASKRQVWLEIGFGRGEHLAAQAHRNPDIGFIGIEPYINGVAAFLGLWEEYGLSNVRLVADDVRDVLPRLNGGCINRIFILFPDPWQKHKHHERRLVSAETVDQLVRILAPGGELRLATDHPGYAGWIRRMLAGHSAIRMLDARMSTTDELPADWVGTRYQEKAEQAGRPTYYFQFERLLRANASTSTSVNDCVLSN